MIGTGILTTSGFLAGQLGSAQLVLLVWVVGAVCALAGAFCYSELGVNFPSSGGEYVYLTEAFGPTWGFMTGWISFFAGFSAPIAAAALAFSDYLGHFFGGLRLDSARHLIGSGAWELKLGAAQILASAIIALFTLINCLGIRRTARVQNVLTSLKIIIILAFLVSRIRLRQRELGQFLASGRAHLRHAVVLAILSQPVLHLRRLQRMERGNLRGRRVEAAGPHASLVAHLRDRAGCGAIHCAQRPVHLRGAARMR